MYIGKYHTAAIKNLIHIYFIFNIVIGDVGTIGGLLSHEYHYISDIGEDIILQCPSCNYIINGNISKAKTCPECKDELHQHNAAEVKQIDH